MNIVPEQIMNLINYHISNSKNYPQTEYNSAFEKLPLAILILEDIIKYKHENSNILWTTPIEKFLKSLDFF